MGMYRCVGVLVGVLFGGSLFASTLLFDDFESRTLSANWAGNTNGQIVSDPLNSLNHVLNFSNTQGGGDLLSIPIANVPVFYLEFDYLFQSPAAYGGGFIGNNDPGETWLAGDCDGCYGTFSPAL